jgi:hypothetical protein
VDWTTEAAPPIHLRRGRDLAPFEAQLAAIGVFVELVGAMALLLLAAQWLTLRWPAAAARVAG